MTAGSPTDATVRRTPAPRQPAAPARAAAQVATAPRFDEDEPEFRLNLGDIPRMRESMDVEGLKPTLLSRLLDIIAPLKA